MGLIEILGVAGSVSLLADWRLYLAIFATGMAMRLGAFDFVPKPFTPDQIRAVLAKVAQTCCWRSASGTGVVMLGS